MWGRMLPSTASDVPYPSWWAPDWPTEAPGRKLFSWRDASSDPPRVARAAGGGRLGAGGWGRGLALIWFDKFQNWGEMLWKFLYFWHRVWSIPFALIRKKKQNKIHGLVGNGHVPPPRPCPRILCPQIDGENVGKWHILVASIRFIEIQKEKEKWQSIRRRRRAETKMARKCGRSDRFAWISSEIFKCSVVLQCNTTYRMTTWPQITSDPSNNNTSNKQKKRRKNGGNDRKNQIANGTRGEMAKWEIRQPPPLDGGTGAA